MKNPNRYPGQYTGIQTTNLSLINKSNSFLFTRQTKFLTRAIFIVLLAIGLATPGKSQIPVNSSSCSGIKPLFDYLLQHNRLNILQSQNITVQSLVNDANAAGFPVNPQSSSVLSSNLHRLFYTTTPLYVSLDSFIFTSSVSAYQAMIGNCSISFKTVDGFFEHKLNSFYSKNCTGSNTIEYTLQAMPASCPRYKIRHLNDGMNWYVNYTDCNGKTQGVWQNASDTAFEICAAYINLVQDIDSIGLIYASSWYDISLVTNYNCPFDAALYNPSTVAVLEINPCAARSENIPDPIITTKAFPNPSSSYFTIDISSLENTPVKIKVTDGFGRMVETRNEVPVKGKITMGSNFRAGLYFVEITQGKTILISKLVKL